MHPKRNEKYCFLMDPLYRCHVVEQKGICHDCIYSDQYLKFDDMERDYCGVRNQRRWKILLQKDRVEGDDIYHQRGVNG